MSARGLVTLVRVVPWLNLLSFSSARIRRSGQDHRRAHAARLFSAHNTPTRASTPIAARHAQALPPAVTEVVDVTEVRTREIFDTLGNAKRSHDHRSARGLLSPTFSHSTTSLSGIARKPDHFRVFHILGPNIPVSAISSNER